MDSDQSGIPRFDPSGHEAHGHEPVLLAEVLTGLQMRPGHCVVDCTAGRGGHSLGIAQHLGATGMLVALDADPRNLEYARERLKNVQCRTLFYHANFAQIDEVLSAAGVGPPDAILADLGLSTNQFLDAQYGMSFADTNAQAPLDMRIDPREPLTAGQIVNRFGEQELADLIYHLADERFSRRIARKIVDARRNRPIKTTGELAELVRSAIPRRGGAKGARGAGGARSQIDPATRTFMALRMKVNGEVENLARLLKVAPGLLKPGNGAGGGRLAIISFHSVEDRAVKQAFRSAEQTGLLRVVTHKPISPSDQEIAANPRARSAKLRVAERT